MNGVLGMAALLSETTLDAEQSGYLQTIKNSGETLINVIRAQNIHHPAIVAMTANAIPEDKEAYLKAGMDDYLPKPTQLNDLLDVLSKFAYHAGQMVEK